MSDCIVLECETPFSISQKALLHSYRASLTADTLVKHKAGVFHRAWNRQHIHSTAVSVEGYDLMSMACAA